MVRVEDIRDWQKEAVTEAFFEYIKQHIFDADAMVHKCLELGNLEEARMHNVKKVCYEDIQDVIDFMVDDAKEGANEDTTVTNKDFG